MIFGLLTTGLSIMRYPDILEAMTVSLQNQFGPGINLRSDSFEGQLLRIVAGQIASLWELSAGVYDSEYPETAQGVFLDNVMSITAIHRLAATYSLVTGNATGTQGTIIPAGAIVSVVGKASSQFQTTVASTIGPGTNEVQMVSFSLAPDAGQWTLVYNGTPTGTLQFNDVAATIQSALEAIIGIGVGNVTVSGNYTIGFTITFIVGAGSRPQPTLTVGTNTLTNGGNAVTFTISKTIPGRFPNVDILCKATVAGPVAAPAHSLTVIVTPVAGWTAFDNELDATEGNPVETDALARLRRKRSLAEAGACTIAAIRSKILQVASVKAAFVFENHTDLVVMLRPPHSFEAVALYDNLPATDVEIGTIIMNQKPAGIQTVSTAGGTYPGTGPNAVHVVVQDPQGFNVDIYFSRPTPVDIYVLVTIKVGDDYPVGTAYSGTFAITTGTKSITGTATHFSTELAPGDSFKIKEGLNVEYMVVDTISSDTAMTVVDDAANTYVTANAYPAVGDTSVLNNILDFAASRFSIGNEVLPDLLYSPVTSVVGVQTLEFDANIGLTGTLAITATTMAVVGTGTLFTSELSPGDRFVILEDDKEEIMEVNIIADDLHLTVVSPAVHTYMAAKAFLTGDAPIPIGMVDIGVFDSTRIKIRHV